MYIKPHTMFSTLHPSVLCVYAFGAPVLAMLSHAPWFLAAAIICAAAVHVFYLGAASTWSAVGWLLPAVCFIAALNVVTNPRGIHILFYIRQQPFTMESLLYGLASGFMLASVTLWFRCFTAFLPNDKFLYLFGKTFPGTALLLSMILKLFPDTKYRMQCIRMADGHVCEGKEQKKSALKRGLRQISCLLEWSMSDCIEMADSMRARAYGSEKRTSYANYRFTGKDACALAAFLLGACMCIAGMLCGRLRVSYYPAYQFPSGQETVIGALCLLYVLLLLMPIEMELMDWVMQSCRRIARRKER